MSTATNTFQCPACGKFVSDGKTEFWDVEPGGCRGSEALSAYCSEACAEATYKKLHRPGGSPKWCVCEDEADARGGP